MDIDNSSDNITMAHGSSSSGVSGGGISNRRSILDRPVIDIDEESYEPPSYDAAFPPLPELYNGSAFPKDGGTLSFSNVLSIPSSGAKRLQGSSPINGSSGSAVKQSAEITHIFQVPLEERRYQNSDNSFGSAKNQDVQTKICRNIAQKTNVHIEIMCPKDQSLSVIIIGQNKQVMLAKKELIELLQKQNEVHLKIPQEYHRFLLGPKGGKLQEIQQMSSTNIIIPKAKLNDNIIIQGAKEGIEKATHAIQIIVAEQSKLGMERLSIPKCYYPFIFGPYNKTLLDMREQHPNVKIHVPPPAVENSEIVVSGEKDGVLAVCAKIKAIYENKRQKVKDISVDIRKSQHKYVIGTRGNGISEILEATGVSVEVPPFDKQSETIVLRGDYEQLGPALTMVYAKANSVVTATVDAPAWLHRLIIGKKGMTLQKITEGMERVQVEFKGAEDKISVEGPTEEVDQVVESLEALTENLLKSVACIEIDIDPKFHRHIIGRSGANINKIKEETGCSIRIPDDNTDWTVKIEGDPQQVEKVKLDIMNLVNKMENEKSKDVIIDHIYHRLLIGSKGSRIKELRDKYPQVQIVFPDPSKKSDIVSIRGPRQEVDPAAKLLVKMFTDLQESSFVQEVKIFKQFHKNIIGKGGVTIRKIREETDTRIELPDSRIDSDVIKISGKQKNVEEAARRIEVIQKELVNLREVTVNIPTRLHALFIGSKGRLIRSIQEDCGGVQIRFPSPESNSEQVTIRGPQQDVEKAKKQLEELTTQKLDQFHVESVKCKSEFHKFLIGRKGANSTQIRKTTGARLVFPDKNEDDKDDIQIYGTKEAVKKAVIELQAQIKELEDYVEMDTEIDPKWHRFFLQRRSAELETISQNFGGVGIYFPKLGSTEKKIKVKGAKKCVEGAIKAIHETVEELASHVTVNVIIPHIHHRALIGRRGDTVQEISSQFGVTIKFPDMRQTDASPSVDVDATGGEVPVTNNDSTPENVAIDAENEHSGESNANVSQFDVILISGKKDQCEEAKEALLNLVPVEEEYPLAPEFHRLVIGQQGKDIQELMNQFKVSISVPKLDSQKAAITIVGSRANLDRVKEELDKRLQEWENTKADRIAKNFELHFDVPVKHHRAIIGMRGAKITEFKEKHNVIINMPDTPGMSPETSAKRAAVRNRSQQQQFGDNLVTRGPETITIRGYQEKAEACRDDILAFVKTLEAYVVEELCIPSEVHPRLIGQKGWNLRKLQEEFGVTINFPGRVNEAAGGDDDKDPSDKVTVIGEPRKVDECCDYLINVANDFLQEMEERRLVQSLQTQPRQTQGGNVRTIIQSSSNNKGNKGGKGFVVSGAPWENKQQQNSKNTNSTNGGIASNNSGMGGEYCGTVDDFPSIISNGGAPSQSGNNFSRGKWGK